jgi:HEAT repeats
MNVEQHSSPMAREIPETLFFLAFLARANVSRCRTLGGWFAVCLTALMTVTACKKSKYDGLSYGGRSFSQWYHRWCDATDNGDKAVEKEARDAMKQIGTNVIPFLLQDLRAEVEQEKEPQIPPAVVFRILGPAGAPAVPELEAMMQQTNIAALNQPATCLVGIGDEALASISRLLTNSHSPTRYHTAFQFSGSLVHSEIFTRGGNLLKVIDPLARCCEDSDPYTAIAAIRALAAINMDPATTTPALRAALQSPNKEVRDEAAAALAQPGR